MHMQYAVVCDIIYSYTSLISSHDSTFPRQEIVLKTRVVRLEAITGNQHVCDHNYRNVNLYHVCTRLYERTGA